MFILKRYKLCNIFIQLHNHAGSCDTLYEVDNSISDVGTYWTMIRTHVVPDRQYVVRWEHTNLPGSHATAIRNLIFRSTPQPVDLTPIPQLLPYM